MMIKNARILVVAAATFVLLGFGQGVLAADSIPELLGLAAEVGSSGPVIHLRADAELETVHYSPQPGVWVVEMPEATWDEGSGFLSRPDLGIERAELSRVEEFGKRLSRLTIWLVAPAQLQLVPRSGGLDLEFTSLTATEEPAPMVVADRSPPPEETAAPEVPMPEPEAEAEPEVVFEAETVDTTRTAATSLVAVVPVRTGDGLLVELEGDGALGGRAFTLSDPERLVVDLPGVINRVERQLYSVNSGLVRQVRVAQFQAVPEPITRVVIDLLGPTDFRLEETGSGTTIVVGHSGSGVMPVEPVVARAEPTAASSTTVISNDSGEIEVTQALSPPDKEPVAVDDAAVSAALFEEPDAEPVAEQELAATSDPLAVEPPAAAPETERSPWVADSSQLIERAPAGQVLETPARDTDSFATQEVASQERRYTGEPITLTLKDADIKDVLRTFSTLTNLNIVVDPGVGGSVTVELRNVPWDQALDLILKINGLGYTLENNVLRIATLGRLAGEKKQAAQLAVEQEKAQPLKTITKPLSYSKASEIASLLRGDSYLLSDRGSVVVDDRTNMLIIRDTVDRVEGILRLIEQLDLPTPQVVIEARIVETTRTFSQQLGISWGFTGVMDAEHGNDTGLRFPNSIDTVGSVNLATGNNGTLFMAFGDILNTFNLDFLLTAAESDGLVKIVSTPRVTTQNLKRAQIRSGLQIPVQTVANNTVTVQYVDATLNLQVTPQITAEGTVNLDIDVKKQEPVVSEAVQGGQNAPIFTRDAQTELLIRDGGTTVIAGIYQINDQRGNDSVPGLGKIPIIGWLFKNREIFNRHDELLIFITPRIVKY